MLSLDDSGRWFRDQRDRMAEDTIEGALAFLPYAQVEELGLEEGVTEATYNADVREWSEQAMREFVAARVLLAMAASREHRRVRTARQVQQCVAPLVFLEAGEPLVRAALGAHSSRPFCAPLIAAIAEWCGAEPPMQDAGVARMASGKPCDDRCHMCLEELGLQPAPTPMKL